VSTPEGIRKAVVEVARGKLGRQHKAEAVAGHQLGQLAAAVDDELGQDGCGARVGHEVGEGPSLGMVAHGRGLGAIAAMVDRFERGVRLM
jgi:hypothetical protein